MPLRSSPSGYCAAVRTPPHSPTADAVVPPASVLPLPPLVSWRSFLLAPRASAPAPQITIFPKGSQNVVRPLHQECPWIFIPFFADAHLWFARARVFRLDVVG